MLYAVLNQEKFDQLKPEEQTHYKKGEDGTFYLDVGKVGTLELSDTAGLRTALEKERASVQRAGKFEKDLADIKTKFGDLDPIRAREALQKLDEMADWDGEEKLKQAKEHLEKQFGDKFKRQEESLTTQFTAQIEKLQKGLTTTTDELRQSKITSAAIQAINAAGGSVKLLLPTIEKYTQLTEDGEGKHNVQVIDDYGNERISVQPGGSSGAMTIDEFVSEMKGMDDFTPAFKGSGASGSGAAGSEGQPTPSGGAKTVDASDQRALSANIEDIAEGKTGVNMGK